eukprot:TRINITY_DN5476_c0_g1_i1.p2 TRINITY_DN5476_c0_g1~~TRINITY_DN5476_c0_g1_i1.p2  ORF type:complete len:107 (+),score=30.19 TRINITY_DN5476_c0_g1_i1:35-322(+)
MKLSKAEKAKLAWKVRDHWGCLWRWRKWLKGLLYVVTCKCVRPKRKKEEKTKLLAGASDTTSSFVSTTASVVSDKAQTAASKVKEVPSRISVKLT